MNLPIIDLLFLLIIFLCAIICLVKGFVNSVFNKAAPILALWAAVLGWRPLSSMLKDTIKISILNYIASFLIIFIAVFIMIKILQMILGNIFEGRILGSLDRTLGFFFGVIEGLVIVLLIMIILTAQPWFDVSGIFAGSIFYRIFAPVVNSNVNAISNSVKNASACLFVGGKSLNV
ncbi:MAG: CvpA family protein [Treponema sp.]|nr:CvpA family protein [Treponema sp.]